jgi:hypothetical protein
MRFHATVDTNGKAATGIRVPDHVMAGLGPSRRPKVRVTETRERRVSQAVVNLRDGRVQG